MLGSKRYVLCIISVDKNDHNLHNKAQYCYNKTENRLVRVVPKHYHNLDNKAQKIGLVKIYLFTLF